MSVHFSPADSNRPLLVDTTPRAFAQHADATGPHLVSGDDWDAQPLNATTPPADGQDSVEPSFIEYMVAWGDTAWSIANRFGVTLDELAEANPEVDLERIYAGQILLVPGTPSVAPPPPPEPVTHVVQAGETLGSIAALYDTTVARLVEINDLPNANRIYVGQVLDVTPPAPPPDLGFVPTSPLPNSRVTSNFGHRPHVETGIGVDNSNHLGIDLVPRDGITASTRVLASGPGTIDAAGLDPYLGYYVRVDHGGGVYTVYGHLEFIEEDLAVGDPVVAGDALGKPGATGNVNGAHLHYEVWVGGVAYDPALYHESW